MTPSITFIPGPRLVTFRPFELVDEDLADFNPFRPS